MKILIVATSNQNKFREITGELEKVGALILSLRDFPSVPESAETGKTFAENARQKAEFYFRHFEKPVLTEDSGLVIPALEGFPGIHSARIAGDDPTRIRLVLEKLRSHSDRSAYYVCSMVLITAEDIREVEADCRGIITESPEGDQGFGYDPIFRPEGFQRTFAQMTQQEKSSYSHRGRAVRKMLPYLLKEFAAT